MKRLLLLAIAFAAVGTLQAQQDNGGISTEMLNVIRQGQSNSLSEKAARNALALNPIAELATNADNLAMIDTNFSHRVKTKGITDQHQSGRCWLFTGLNVLRAKMIDPNSCKSAQCTLEKTTALRSGTFSLVPAVGMSVPLSSARM